MKDKVILGVSGSISAYKAADLSMRMKEMGLEVHVVMTAAAEKLITPLTFEALTGNPVTCSGMPEPGKDPMPHITVSRGASLVVVAPATANVIGKAANGIADDSLTSILLASNARVIFAPAMNTEMYNKPVVQENIKKLQDQGGFFIGPTTGTLACGDEGLGKLSDVDDIMVVVKKFLRLKRDLAGKKIIVSAGGTREPIDPVRFLGNRSSGKMGVAIANEAVKRGADVTMIAGALETHVSDDLEVIRAFTADAMLEEIESRFPGCHCLIMAAAVGDYKVRNVANNKIKKMNSLLLDLEKNTDILSQMEKLRKEQIVVGFAAETERAVENGKEKLLKKNLHMIVVNDVSRKDIGFGADDNEVTIIMRSGDEITPNKVPKAELAEIIIDKVVELLPGKFVDGR